MVIQHILPLVLLLLVALSQCPCARSTYVFDSPMLTLEFADTGVLVRLNTSSNLRLDNLSAGTAIGCQPQLLNPPSISPCIVAGAAGGGDTSIPLCIERHFAVADCEQSRGATAGTHNITVLDTFTAVDEPQPHVAWGQVFTQTGGSTFRVPLLTEWNVTAPAAGQLSFWAPRTGSDAAEDILQELDFPPPAGGGLELTFGETYGYGEEGAVVKQATPVPMLVLLDNSGAGGVAVLPALNDTTLAAVLSVRADGSSSFARLFNRLAGADASVMFTTYLLALPPAAGWRPALGFLRTKHAEILRPRTTLPLAAYAGLGTYTCAGPPAVNSSALARAGATLAWDAHFWWPYIGMGIPPNATWASNTGSGEQTSCGAFTHGQRVGQQTMGQYYRDLRRAANMTALAYFNLFEFGENVEYPAAAGSGNWTDSSQFLAAHLNDSVLLVSPGHATYTWQRAVVLDPGVDSWRAFLLAQAQAHVDGLGADFRGFAVDRSDHISAYNMFRADNASWCGQPCASLLLPFLDLSEEVGQIVRAADSTRLMTLNFNGNDRADTLRAFDAVFSEGAGFARRNSIALATTGMPGIQWTYGPADFAAEGGLDAYMQRRLLLQVFPMVPVLGADHSIGPQQDPHVMAAYLDYAPLFQAVAAAEWWLDGVAEVGGKQNGAVANAFVEVGGDALVVVVLVGVGLGEEGEGEDTVVVTVQRVGGKSVDLRQCEVRGVGAEAAWRPAPPGGVGPGPETLAFPRAWLGVGCGVVRCQGAL